MYIRVNLLHKTIISLCSEYHLYVLLGYNDKWIYFSKDIA